MVNRPPPAAQDPLAKMWIRSKAWLRRDGAVIVLFALATLLISYPLVFRLDGQWLGLVDTDTYVKLWDNWWLRNHAFSEPSFNFTELQFHPTGLDLSFHSISWTVAFLSWPLAILTDAITAYNLTILIALFSTAYAAYLLVRRFVRYRAAAWLAGAVYSFAPYHVTHAGGHPDLVHLAPIPIAVLLLTIAVTKRSVLAALGAALAIGLAAFTSLYIMVFALLTIGPIFLCLLLDKRRWAQREIWPIVAVFVLVSATLLTVRLAPIFRDADGLSGAIALKYTAERDQTDLLSYVLPSHLNPLFAPYTKEIADEFSYMNLRWPAYLGFVPLALIISALTWKKQRKIVLLWLSIGLIFVILSLGPTLRFNGKLYEAIVLPARYLTWFPPIKAVGRPNFFVLGVLLPVAVMAAVGFDRLLRHLAGRRVFQMVVMIALPTLLLVEFWIGEFPGISAGVNPFYSELAQQADDLAIIQLPMGRYDSKRYLYLQTIHHKAIVEGLSARTLPATYQYIEDNYLLQNWFNDQPLNCSTAGRRAYMTALDQLTADGFRYVILHQDGMVESTNHADYLAAEPLYQDDELAAFSLADLRNQPPCQDIYERVFDLPARQEPISISWDQKIKLLGYDSPTIDPGSQVLSLPVYWQSLAEMEASYFSFFHVVDKESGAIVGQTDVIPRGWTYPTNWWMKGEVVEDTVQISLEGLPPGAYELYVGWYEAESGQRLSPSSDEAPITPDNRALLTVVDF